MDNAESKLNLIVTSSPHITARDTTRRIMLDVIIALTPAAIMSAVYFGTRSLIVMLVCVGSCIALEGLWCAIFKKPEATRDLSCVVTGMLLAFNLPAGISLWLAVLASFIAIIIVKQLFGGIGCNLFNPALAGRAVLGYFFWQNMTAFSFPFGQPDAVTSATELTSASATVDVLASATPLRVIQTLPNADISLWDLFIGRHGGVLGETCAAALLIGGIYLVIRKVISPIIPLVFIGSTTLFLWIFGCPLPLHSALSGGLFLGAIFMATDYSTSPYTKLGKVIFGVGCGLFTALLRTFGTYPEGVSYAILAMNLLVPLINHLVRRKPYGTPTKAELRV